jgi:hypothetical protein
MRKVVMFSLLLIAGMIGAQLLPGLAGEAYADVSHGLRLATMVGLQTWSQPPLPLRGVNPTVSWTQGSGPWRHD